MKYILYNHGGSQNHGCEALARTAVKLFSHYPLELYTESISQDIQYNLDQIVPLVSSTHTYSKLDPFFWKAYLKLKTVGDYTMMDTLSYRKAIDEMPPNATVISIGGDIYCYEDYKKFISLHKRIAKKHKTVLLGCSINEELIYDPEFCEDMRQYTYITARESLSFELLKKIGIQNIDLCPDSAFLLPEEKRPLPNAFQVNNTVGINLSPLVIKKGRSEEIVKKAFLQLMKYILDNTECAIALIPHVVWTDNDDRTVLKELYDEVNCPERVSMINDCNCMQLKGYISRCRFFIGARTHASIAAYSSGVPTLVLGYSTKSRGIAKDIFGTAERYVISVDDVIKGTELIEAFQWLWENELNIKDHLLREIPTYKSRAYNVVNTLKIGNI